MNEQPTPEGIRAVAAFAELFDAEGFEAGSWPPLEAAAGGVLSLAFWSPSRTVLDWHQAIYFHHIHLVFDWMTEEWREVMRGYETDPNALETAGLDTVRRVLTTISRASRFSEGYMAECFENGLAQAATRRLAELSGG